MTLLNLNKNNKKLLNNKGAYDFIDLTVFLVFWVVIFSVIIFAVSVDQPTVYPNIDADNFVVTLLYSKNAIFDKFDSIDKMNYGVLNLNNLNNLDNRYQITSSNDILAAKLKIVPNDKTKAADAADYYYNRDKFMEWTQKEIAVRKYHYSVPVKYYKDPKNISDGVLEIDVYYNVQKPLTYTK